MGDFGRLEAIRSLASMADTAELKPESTDNRKARQSDPEDNVIKDAEEMYTEPANPNGSTVEKAQTAREEEKPKPSKLKELWGRLGLDIGTIMMMFK